MTTRLTPALLEIKRASITAEGEFTGYASTFGGPPDAHGDIIRKGAFQPAIQTHRGNGTRPAMLWAHDTGEPVGKWLSFVEDNHGLLVRGKIITETKRGAESLALMRDDAVGLSIGFAVAKDGAEYSKGIREITAISHLVEVSLVAVPANHRATITQVDKPATVRDFQKAMRGIGFSSRESKFVTTRGFRDLLAPGERSQIDRLTETVEKLQRTIESKIL